MSWRLLQVGGRPDFLPVGSSGASLAHCSLVRSPRPMPGASHGTPPLLKHTLGANTKSRAFRFGPACFAGREDVKGNAQTSESSMNEAQGLGWPRSLRATSRN